MFDFSFAELMVCFLVALVVLGPEKLPGIARNLGRWTGQARSYLRNLSLELERETNLGDLKKQVHDAGRLLREQSESAKSAVAKLTSAEPANPKPPSPDPAPRNPGAP